VAAARAAFDGWANTTPGERSLALLKIADAIEERADEFTTLEVANAGKPQEAFKNDEIPAMVDNLRFFAGAARNLEGKAAGEYLEGYTSWIRREPVGVVGQIAPWNYPLMMAIWKIGPALAAGCTIVLKPAETTPLTTLQARRALPGVPAERRAQRHRRPRRPAGQASSRTPTSTWSRSPARSRPASGSPARRPTPSSTSTSSSAARRRW
jgi:betaine-aldehyde dehydrogenase